jgi:hypothetical protein
MEGYESDTSVDNAVEHEPDLNTLSNTELTPETTGPAKDAFRLQLSEWKRSHLEPITEDSQDTMKLKEYLEKTKVLYNDLLQNPQKEPLSNKMSSVEFQEILQRDLVESPFTYDTKLINSLSSENDAFDGTIIPNQ